MGVLAFVVDKTASAIDKLLAMLPGFSISSDAVESAIGTIQQYLGIVNIIFPMDIVIVVLGLLCTFASCMFAFYAIQRLINLMRGAG